MEKYVYELENGVMVEIEATNAMEAVKRCKKFWGETPKFLYKIIFGDLIYLVPDFWEEL
jgi:hypothetical protein